MRDRPGARAADLAGGGESGDVCGIRTKWRLIHPETPVDLSVLLFDSLAEFICSKGSNSVGYRVDWCINHRLQSNQFVGRRDEEEVTSITINQSINHNQSQVEKEEVTSQVEKKFFCLEVT